MRFGNLEIFILNAESNTSLTNEILKSRAFALMANAARFSQYMRSETK